MLNYIKIRDNKNELKLLLHLLSNISNSYHRYPVFYSKIERILQIFKEDIKKNYSNSETFDIFKSNKRILLFLIEEEMIKVDEYFVKKIITKEYVDQNYPHYFCQKSNLL